MTRSEYQDMSEGYSTRGWASVRTSDHTPSTGHRLAGLKPGQSVRLVADGRERDVTVQRWSRDGSMDNARLTVGYGPGRWNREVTAAQIHAGFVDLLVQS